RKTYRPKGAMNVLLDGPLKGVVFSKARQGVLAQTHGHYPATLKAIEVVCKIYDMKDRQRALQIEREAFCEMAVTDVSRNLLHVFDLTEMVKRQTGLPAGATAQARPVTHLGVLGAGTMGGGIAYVGADKGIDVRMKDINHEAISR